jgi:hypothetical protein
VPDLVVFEARSSTVRPVFQVPPLCDRRSEGLASSRRASWTESARPLQWAVILEHQTSGSLKVDGLLLP